MTPGMPAASFDEIRFFLDDRDDVAHRVQDMGATTTQVMAAVGAHESHEVAADPFVREVCAILDEEEQATDIDVDTL